MVVVDVTVVNVAVPQIVKDLGIGAAATQWVQSTYTLTVAGLLVAAGRVADRWGRRRTLLAGVALFLVGSVLAAIATTGSSLVVARGVQGIGGAAILPSTLALLNATFEGPARARAFAVWGATVGGVAAAGPLLGGWLTTQLSWRWAFWVNIGLGLSAALGAWAFVPESRDRTGRPLSDPVGLALAVLIPTSLVTAVLLGRTQGWWAPAPGAPEVAGVSLPAVCIGSCVLAGTALVLWERDLLRSGRRPLFDLDLLRIPTFARGNLVVLVVALGQIGLLFVLPLWLQGVLGFSAVQTGLLFLPLAVGAFAAAAVTPLAARAVGVRTVIGVGLLAEIAVLAALALTLSPSSSPMALVPLLFGYGAGVGTAEAQLPGLLLAHIPADTGGSAAGIQSTSQELGSALGVALLGTVLLSATAADLHDRLAAHDMTGAQQQRLTRTVTDTSGTAIPTLPDALARTQARAAFTHATATAAAAGALTLALGAATLFAPTRRRRRNDDTPRPLEVGRA
ncbi:MFS transporter [Phycicoccus avicenniae]|uniref:MFS transporter n=1 Tax=Phycicoccus avicenniae TaxID=2828860 RepID=UPI0024AF6B6C|nr:MFS transporter [Phycicoccus avicenniae]